MAEQNQALASNSGTPADEFKGWKNPFPAASGDEFAGWRNPFQARERSLPTIAKDLGASFGAGANALLEMGGNLYGLASGRMDNWAAEQGARGREWFQAQKSPELKAMEAERQAKIDAQDNLLLKAGTAMWETLKSPSLLSAFAFEQAAPLLTTGLAGRGAGLAARALGAGEKAAGTAAFGGAVGAGGVMQGADMGDEAYDKLQALPDELWLLNDEVKARVDAGEPLEQVKHEQALALSRNTAIAAGVTSVGLNLLPGASVLEKSLAGVKLPTGSMFGGALKGFVGEAAQEAAEEGGGVLFTNLAAREIDPQTDLSAGVAEAAGMGAVGGIFGGVAGALQARDSAPRIAEVLEAPDVDSAILAARAMVEEASRPALDDAAPGAAGEVSPPDPDPLAEQQRLEQNAQELQRQADEARQAGNLALWRERTLQANERRRAAAELRVQNEMAAVDADSAPAATAEAPVEATRAQEVLQEQPGSVAERAGEGQSDLLAPLAAPERGAQEEQGAARLDAQQELEAAAPAPQLASTAEESLVAPQESPDGGRTAALAAAELSPAEGVLAPQSPQEEGIRAPAVATEFSTATQAASSAVAQPPAAPDQSQPAPALAQPPTTEALSTGTEDVPQLLLRANGQPFATDKQARASRQFRRTPGAAVVPVEGGFAVQPPQQQEEVDVAKALESARFSVEPSNPAAQEFVSTSEGATTDFGEITGDQAAAIGRQAGKIRLPRGVQREDGTGYGLAHIEANHGKQIRNAGFASVEDFVQAVASTFNQIRQAKGRQLLVAVKGDRQDVMYVQLEPAEDGDYYRVNTAFPASRDYLEKQEGKGGSVLWDGSEPQSTAAGRRPLYADSPGSVSGPAVPIAQGQSSEASVARATPADQVSSTGLGAEGVRQAISETLLTWRSGPEVEVVESFEELPESIRGDAQAVNGEVTGAYDPMSGTVYLVGGKIRSAEQAQRVLAHEAVGHHAFEQQFGDELEGILNKVDFLRYRSETVRKIAEEVHETYPGLSRIDKAAEVVARLAEQRVAHPVLLRIKAAIRKLLRTLGLAVQFSEDDLRAMILTAARSLRTRSSRPPRRRGGSRFSAEAAPAQPGVGERSPIADGGARPAQAPAQTPTDAGTVIGSMPAIESHAENFLRLRGFFDSASDVLRRDARLRPVGEAVYRFYDDTRKRLGQASRIIDGPVSAVRALPKAEREAAFEQFEAYIREREAGRREQAAALREQMTPEAIGLLEAWERVADFTGTENQKAGVKVFDAKLNAWRPIGKVRSFFPRAMKKEVLNAVLHPTARGSAATWNKIAEELAAAGKIDSPDVVKAAEFMRAYQDQHSDKTQDDYFAGIERARAEPLPEWFYDFSWDVAARYVERWAESISRIENFGQRAVTGRDIFSQAMRLTLDERTRNYLGRVQERVYNTNSTDPMMRGLGYLSAIATAIQLGNPATAMLNLLGGTALNFQAFGFKKSIRALGEELVGLGKAVKDAREIGILVDDYLTMMHDLQQQGVSEAMGRFVSGALKWGGYTVAEELVRAHSMLTAKAMLRDALAQWNRQIDSRPSLNYIAWSQRNGFDYRKLLQENGAGAETERLLRYAVNLTQGSYKIDQTPVFVDTPMGRFVLKYQKFSVQLTRMFWKNHLKPFVDTLTKGGEQVYFEKGGKRYSARVKTAMPMFTFFAAAFGAGSAIALLREAIFGYQDPGPDLDEIEKALDDDDTANAVALMFARFWHSLMSVGALGFFGNYSQMLLDVADRQRVKSPLSPPALAPLQGAAEIVLRWAEQGQLTPRDFDEIASQQLSLYRTLKRAGLGAIARVTDSFDLANLEEANRDKSYIRKMTRRYADAIGLEAKRRAPDRIGKTPMSPVNGRIVDALLVGDAARAAVIAQEHLNTLTTAADIDSALASMRGAVRSGQPVLVSVAPSERERQAFLKWAQETVDPTDYQKIVRADETYRDAAIRAGLMVPPDPRRQARQAVRDARAARPMTQAQRRLYLRREGIMELP